MEQTHFRDTKCVCLSAMLRVAQVRPALSVTVHESPILDGFTVAVRDGSGKLLPLRASYQSRLAKELKTVKAETISLAGEMSSTASLSEMYHLKYGHYSVIVKRQVPNRSGTGLVEAVSGPTYFTIG